MPTYDFSKITAIESSKDLINTVLYRTTRKTPTVVRKGFKISRIRSFYMLKVKFTQNTIDTKLSQIVDQFPKIDDVHPFYRYWFNIMYDKDHFKVALAQIQYCKELVDKVGKHYIKLLKHADSLFQCKSLKVAALGRMVSLLAKQNPYLEFLEQVREHMSRLPAIDPSTRSVVLAGYPSVGKSSLLNTLSRANVDVEPWAFTTQSLLVGHAEVRGLRFQLIDSPGLLDHQLAERNTIELETITALAYLNAAIIYVIDVTEGTAFLEKQVRLFEELRPFFENKPTLIVLNKMDSWNPSELTPTEHELIQSLSPQFPLAKSFDLAGIDYPDESQIVEAETAGGDAAREMLQAIAAEEELRASIVAAGCTPILCCSATTHTGVERALSIVCDELLQIRQAESNQELSQSVTGTGTAAIPGLFVAQPRNEQHNRPALVPPSVQQLNEQLLHPRPLGSADGFTTELQRENEAGGCTVYNLDERRFWILDNEAERYDKIPYIHNGKNIMDFISGDEDVTALIEQLEKEEQELQAQKPPIDDAELFARLAAFEKAVGRAGPGRLKKMKQIIQREAERKAVLAAPKMDPGELHRNTPYYEGLKTRDQRLVEENKNAVSLDVIKREFNRERKDGERAYAKLRPHISKPKHLMTGKMSLRTRDWR